MRTLDWIVVVAYLTWVVGDGLRQARQSRNVEGFLVASRSLPWWLVGLSVMATQLSAITMIGTTGQAYLNGMRFLQYYYALPLAMIVLSVTLVPFFHRANVFTAYQYLEKRFDAKTRTFTALLFLFSRSLSCGVVISAPAVVMSVILGLNTTFTCLLIGIPTTIFTMFGGVRAIAYTDVKQMFAVVASLLIAVTVLMLGLPDGVGVGDALRVAGTTGRLQMFDFRLDFTEQYTFWSGTIAALFLYLSYFGTDQSQVQRYLAAKSVDEARSSLMVSAFWKIPLQALILLVGVLVYVYYLFVPAPVFWNPSHAKAVQAADPSAYVQLEREANAAWVHRSQLATELALRPPEERASARPLFREANAEYEAVRAEALKKAEQVTGGSVRDVNYIIPQFVLHELPVGLAGLFIAAVIAAAMARPAHASRAILVLRRCAAALLSASTA